MITTSAVIGAVLVGYVIGILQTVYANSKRECRECYRRMLEYGVKIDGKDYVLMETEI